MTYFADCTWLGPIGFYQCGFDDFTWRWSIHYISDNWVISNSAGATASIPDSSFDCSGGENIFTSFTYNSSCNFASATATVSPHTPA